MTPLSVGSGRRCSEQRDSRNKLCRSTCWGHANQRRRKCDLTIAPPLYQLPQTLMEDRAILWRALDTQTCNPQQKLQHPYRRHQIREYPHFRGLHMQLQAANVVVDLKPVYIFCQLVHSWNLERREAICQNGLTFASAVVNPKNWASNKPISSSR
jgi:hypothetical protein